MKPTEIITMARNQTGTSVALVPQDEAFQYLNIVESDFRWDIANESIGDQQETWNINLVAGTGTYSLPVSVAASTLSASTFGINQIMKAGVKLHSNDTYYTPLQIKYIEGYLNLPDFYAATQTSSIPTAYIIDGESITIFPTPTETITAGLQLIGPQATIDKSTSTEDVEGMILVDHPLHYVLVEGLKYWFYGKRGPDFAQLAMNAKQNYENEKLRTINQLSNKNILADEPFNLDLSYLG